MRRFPSSLSRRSRSSSKKLTVDASPDGALKTLTFELQLLCFEVGTHELGPIRVRVTSAEGEPQRARVELRRRSRVRSLLANEPDPQLKPPTAPVVVEQDDYRLLIALGVLLALALGALARHGLFMRWWQRRDRPGARAAAAPSAMGDGVHGAP